MQRSLPVWLTVPLLLTLLTAVASAQEMPVDITADGSAIATADGALKRKVRVRDTDSLRERFEMSVTTAVSAVRFSADGKRLLVGESGRTVHVLDAATGRELKAFEVGIDGTLNGACISPDGSCIAALCVSFTAENSGIWFYTSTGRQQSRWQGGREAFVWSRESGFSADGSKLVLCGMMNRRTINVATGTVTETDQYGTVKLLSPDGSRYVQNPFNGEFTIVTIAGGARMTVPAVVGRTPRASWSPDGKLLAVTSPTGRAVFDVSGSEPRELVKYTDNVRNAEVLFHPRAGRVFTVVDRKLAVVDTATKSAYHVGDTIPPIGGGGGAAAPAPGPGVDGGSGDEPSSGNSAGPEFLELEAPRRGSAILDRRTGFYAEIPAWPKPTAPMTASMLVQFFNTKMDGRFRANININAEKKNATREELGQQLRAAYTALGCTVQSVLYRDVDRREAAVASATGTLGGQQLAFRVLAVADSGYVFVLTCTCRAEDIGTYGQDFETCMQSLRFSDKIDVPRGCTGYASSIYGISLLSPAWTAELMPMTDRDLVRSSAAPADNFASNVIISTRRMAGTLEQYIEREKESCKRLGIRLKRNKTIKIQYGDEEVEAWQAEMQLPGDEGAVATTLSVIHSGRLWLYVCTTAGRQGRTYTRNFRKATETFRILE